MARWKLFNRSKEKKQGIEKEIDIPIIEDEEPVKQKEEVFFKATEVKEETPITEYHETLYSSDHPLNKGKKPLKRTSWESTSTIEKNVDTIDKKKTVYKQTSSGVNDTERKVDKLFSKKGIKTMDKKKVKSSAVPEGYLPKVNKKTGLTYYKKK